MIILIAGENDGVGKTTLAESIKERNPSSELFAFADPIKDLARTLGWDGIKDEKGRRFLRELGQSVRHYNKRYWADEIVKQMSILPDYDVDCIVHDWRFVDAELYVMKETANRFEVPLKTIYVTDPSVRHLPKTDESQVGIPEDFPFDLVYTRSLSIDAVLDSLSK